MIGDEGNSFLPPTFSRSWETFFLFHLPPTPKQPAGTRIIITQDDYYNASQSRRVVDCPHSRNARCCSFDDYLVVVRSGGSTITESTCWRTSGNTRWHTMCDGRATATYDVRTISSLLRISISTVPATTDGDCSQSRRRCNEEEEGRTAKAPHTKAS